MRIRSLAVLILLAGAAVFGGTRPEALTYVDGNLDGVSPHTRATLWFSDDVAAVLRAGSTSVAIPYLAITSAELGAVKDSPSKGSSFTKLFSPKAETQTLRITFKNAKGEEKNMNLELAKTAAQNAVTAIRAYTIMAALKVNKPDAEADGSWWGDKYWKTKANQDKVAKPAATAAPEQQ